MFSDFDEKFLQLYNNVKIHSHSIFIRANELCVYLEYFGDNFEKDNLKLNNLSKVSEWNTKLYKYLNSDWKEMKEVFHTD